MSKKRYVVHIWFLDQDLQASAQMLTDKALSKSIDGCFGTLVSTCMYLVGIRSKKFHSYFFSKENVHDTMSTKFCGWPLKKTPKFNAYEWRESKWCRSCHENYDFICNYLAILLDEHAYRYSSTHELQDVASWLSTTDVVANFPYVGIDDVVLPWTSIDPRFRDVDIVKGYRKQYCSQIEDGDAFAAYAKCKRDIPQFVVDEFNLENAFER